MVNLVYVLPCFASSNCWIEFKLLTLLFLMNAVFCNWLEGNIKGISVIREECCSWYQTEGCSWYTEGKACHSERPWDTSGVDPLEAKCKDFQLHWDNFWYEYKLGMIDWLKGPEGRTQGYWCIWAGVYFQPRKPVISWVPTKQVWPTYLLCSPLVRHY